jgi:acid stress chaperone HdeB
MERRTTMTPRSILAGLSLTALLIPAAHAQVSIDVAKITCDQMRNKVANPVAVALWLNGYYAGKRNDTAIDVISLDRNAEKVAEYCMSNPETTLMKAIETTVGAAK